ncbi:MAG TPA: hypothetical protein VIL71_21465 [Spirillospora sp.]
MVMRLLAGETMAGARDCVDAVTVVPDGREFSVVHRSVLDRVTEIADGLGCAAAAALGDLPVSFSGSRLERLRRDLEQVIAFADAARRTAWTIGDIAVAPADRKVMVMDMRQGELWADPVHGFELHGSGGMQRVTELDSVPGTARRVSLGGVIVPLAEAAARAEELQFLPREAE